MWTCFPFQPLLNSKINVLISASSITNKATNSIHGLSFVCFWCLWLNYYWEILFVAYIESSQDSWSRTRKKSMSHTKANIAVTANSKRLVKQCLLCCKWHYTTIGRALRWNQKIVTILTFNTTVNEEHSWYHSIITRSEIKENNSKQDRVQLWKE